MANWVGGLRFKSVMALLLVCALALVPAALAGLHMLENIRGHFGASFAHDHTELNRQRILAPLIRDLALARRLADSLVTRDWLLDEEDAAKRTAFFTEAEGYRRDFLDGNYFLISAISRHYYLNDRESPHSDAPRYTLDPDNPDDGWFFATIASDAAYNINVNPDVTLGVTRVWINVVVNEEGRRIGLAGTGFDLGGFLDAYVSDRLPGVTPLIIDGQGAIQAHPDPDRIAYGAGAGVAADTHTLADLLGTAEQRGALLAAMDRAVADPGQVETLWATLEGRTQLLALSYIPDLRWHVVTALDLSAANVVDSGWVRIAVIAVVLLFALVLGAFVFAVDRLVLRPLRELQHSANAIAEGDFRTQLPRSSSDEIGDLSRAFGVMAGRIQAHTTELEDKVRARTNELEEANREMAAAQKKLSDSIDYASMIQRALLPDRSMEQELGGGHFVLWHPRDVVGGDFYLFRSEGGRMLVGVVDCAGHGVPGALMTMLARAAFDDAMNRRGIGSPAALLTHADGVLRGMLAEAELPRGIATNMDAGLVHIDREQGRMRFSGARIGLYWSDGREVGESRGGRRPLCDRRVGEYEDVELAISPGVTYYLATDGYLDQAGGELGFGFGNTRFADLIREHARAPMDQQAATLDEVIRRYRGPLPQRDDITILAFRLDQAR